ncbi:TraI domain-containing protein [Proteus alimentorum]|uniref:TraI domain-containing protein n=1 Tax=Proteus alimentorum TaxID=1973495 RepID=UPI001F0A55D5|nr:TraI domain-containing protein [Proteus alimentorum]
MLNLKLCFQRIGSFRKIKKEINSEIPSHSLLPISLNDLLLLPHRQQLLKSLWNSSSLSQEAYTQFYKTPLEQCIFLMQQFPLSEKGAYNYLGGMVDYMLEVVTCASKLSKNYMLPIDASPEEQAEQDTVWHAVIVYASLFSCAEYLCHFEVELKSRKRWFPLQEPLTEPYRFRFLSETSETQMRCFGAMLAWKIIPPDAINWLSQHPKALEALSMYLTGFREQTGIVDDIVSKAITLTLAPFQREISLPESDVLSENISLGERAPAVISGMQLRQADNQITDMGNAFWQWLIERCVNGDLSINQPNAQIHIIAGYVFIVTPNIFYVFLAEMKLPKQDKDKLQKVFERLKYHRHDRGNMFTCRLFQNELLEGQFKKLSGYLIPENKIFTSNNKPTENPLLVVV